MQVHDNGYNNSLLVKERELICVAGKKNRKKLRVSFLLRFDQAIEYPRVPFLQL